VRRTLTTLNPLAIAALGVLALTAGWLLGAAG
jgi:hypothetical protein